MKTILIGTTAINRPPLHSDVFPDWIKWIRALEGYNLRWFINIDMVDKLPYTFEETKDNLKGIAGEIGVYFLGGEKGNFLNACKRVAGRIEEYVKNEGLKVDDVMVFWLEDDWKLNMSVLIELEGIIKNYMSDLCHINFSFIRNNYIHALAPSLISYKLWKEMHLAAWKKQEKHIDPEHCVGVYVCKEMRISEDKLNNLTVITRYKEISDGYVEKNKFTNYENSYFTFDDDRRMDMCNYVEKSKCIEKFKGEILFVRITMNFVLGGCDYGRNYMEKNNLCKARVQDDKNKDFYN